MALFQENPVEPCMYQLVNSSVCPRPVFAPVFFPSLLALVQPFSFPQQQDKPVDLWSQYRHVTHVALQGQMEGHFMRGNSKLPAVHPVHEGEDGNPTCKETEEDNNTIESVQPGVVEAQLDIRGQEKEGM